MVACLCTGSADIASAPGPSPYIPCEWTITGSGLVASSFRVAGLSPWFLNQTSQLNLSLRTRVVALNMATQQGDEAISGLSRLGHLGGG